jgi:uncharacterized protein (DUF885 family)
MRIKGSLRQQCGFVTIVAILLLSLNSTGGLAATSADAAFDKLAADYLDALPGLSPVNATLIGDHRYDDRLDQVNRVARENRRDTYMEFRSRLGKLDRDTLSRANQIDADLLLLDVESSLWTLETFAEWAWNPMMYVNLAGSSIYGLMARDFAPIATRLENTTARLEQLPRFFRQARGAINAARVPKIHAETAIQQNPD